jgi:protein tyrosine phosphatase (PTP) superfamily phosphohydrolase (DUF442 family)
MIGNSRTSKVATLVSAFALVACVPAWALVAPNVVVIDPNLVTSGQPTAASLSALAEDGFEAVIYLAPLTVPDAVKSEAELLAKQGIEFVHIPIPFGAPTEAHFEQVSAALTRLKAKKVLVHCQVNMRASVMVFLHRVLRRNESATTAYDAVSQVWSPQGPWKEMAQSLLRKHKVAFDLY